MIYERYSDIEIECRKSIADAHNYFINPTSPHLARITYTCDKVADIWEAWCGETPWSKYMRQAGTLGVRCVYFDGVPRSASAIPLTFVLVDDEGKWLTNGSTLRELRNFVKNYSQ